MKTQAPLFGIGLDIGEMKGDIDLFEALRLVRILVALLLAASGLAAYIATCAKRHDQIDIPTENRLFHWEPSFVARIRWAFWSRDILSRGSAKHGERPWRLARGDKDIIVFPPSYIPELNKMSAAVTNSRAWHSETMLSHLTGMTVITRTNHHHRLLLGRISPAVPQLLRPTAQRTAAAIDRLFPQDPEKWIWVNALDVVVESVTQGIALSLVGPGACDSPYLVKLLENHTRLIFTTVFITRLVPAFLAPYFVWLLPSRWQLVRSWTHLEDYVRPLAERGRGEEQDDGNDDSASSHPDLVSSMVRDARGPVDADPTLLGRLVGAVATGGTYSIANFVTGALADLASGDPGWLNEVRDEIRAKNAELLAAAAKGEGDGRWDAAAFASLWKLESSMKETARLAPGALVVFGRVIDQDHVLPNGVRLQKGDNISVSAMARAFDEDLFADPARYDGGRFYRRDGGVEALRAQPFTSIESDILTWGSGRWSCPGRFIANLSAKVALVKILDEFDFDFDGAKRPPNLVLHEFTFVRPNIKMRMRRRKDACGIRY